MHVGSVNNSRMKQTSTVTQSSESQNVCLHTFFLLRKIMHEPNLSVMFSGWHVSRQTALPAHDVHFQLIALPYRTTASDVAGHTP